MKHLCLLRHAKSSWAAAASGQPMRDFDRPLNARGREAAPVIGAYCAKENVSPDLILCSSAARTRETLQRIEPFFAHRPPVIFKDGLYLASADRLLQEIARAPANDDTLMVIGHNSGLEDLARALAHPTASRKTALQALYTKYPTGGLARFTFDVAQWTDVDEGEGVLIDFVTPRSLLADGG